MKSGFVQTSPAYLRTSPRIPLNTVDSQQNLRTKLLLPAHIQFQIPSLLGSPESVQTMLAFSGGGY